MSATHHDQLANTNDSSGMNPPSPNQGEVRATPSPSTALSRPVKTALLMVALVGSFYLLREHWNHVAGNWIYLLLVACPLMHLFHGHGGHGRNGAHAAPLNKPADKKE
jgi:hypothetical protein